jgi:hypothetical protein
VDLPVSQKFSFNETESFDDLWGDDQVQGSHGGGPLVEWKLEAGGIALDAWKTMVGGTVTSTGTTPAQIKTFAKQLTDARPYFQTEGQAISDSGGDIHGIVPRCKVTGDFEGEFARAAFFITNASGKGYGNATIGLYKFVQNETAVAIP